LKNNPLNLERIPTVKTTFALIDCNNFFVSCERLFRPDLAAQPVVVLSSNDGCVIARSNEAKALGVPMGAPLFKYRQLFQDHNVTLFSANFELYGDISTRIARLLTRVTPRIEIYSVDESFLDLHELNIPDYTLWGQQLAARVRREVGIPVSIGIAPSKTLAKLASECAKHDPRLAGALDLTATSVEQRQRILQDRPIQDVWGIGWRLAPKLKAVGVHTAHQLSQLSPQLAKQLMGIHGRQLVSELNGTSCYPLEPAHKPRQSIMRGRTFGEDTGDPLVIEAAIANLAARACLQLRQADLLACSAVVSLSTNRFKPGYSHQSSYVTLPLPSADTGLVTAELQRQVASMVNSHAAYHRANVLFYNLISPSALQTDLFGTLDVARSDQSQRRLQAFDAINQRHGAGLIRYAAEDLSQVWQPKHDLRSPRFTTNWQDLPIAQTS
jgi:DNA polymerase V